MTLREVLKIIEDISNIHSVYDNHTEYNQGWTDACEYIDSILSDSIKKTEET